MNPGSVIKTFATETNPPKVKYFLVVGSDHEYIACILINTNPRLNEFPDDFQGLQIPLNQDNCPFLDHNSFADCSKIFEKEKKKINEVLQKEPKRLIGIVPTGQLTIVINKLRISKSIITDIKKKYGFWF